MKNEGMQSPNEKNEGLLNKILDEVEVSSEDFSMINQEKKKTFTIKRQFDIHSFAVKRDLS